MKIGQNTGVSLGVIFRPEKGEVISPYLNSVQKALDISVQRKHGLFNPLGGICIKKDVLYVFIWQKICIHMFIYLQRKAHTSHISYVYYVYNRFLDPPPPYIPHLSLTPNGAPRKIPKQNSQLPTTPRVIFGV